MKLFEAVLTRLAYWSTKQRKVAVIAMICHIEMSLAARCQGSVGHLRVEMGLLSCWLVVVEWCVRPRGVEQRSTRQAPDRDCTKRGAWWALLAWVAGTCNSEFVGFQKGKSIVDGFLNWDVAQLQPRPWSFILTPLRLIAIFSKTDSGKLGVGESVSASNF